MTTWTEAEEAQTWVIFQGFWQDLDEWRDEEVWVDTSDWTVVQDADSE